MATDKQIAEKIFESVLRAYFFEDQAVKKEIPAMEKGDFDTLVDEDNSDGLDNQKRKAENTVLLEAREIAFRNFLKRVNGRQKENTEGVGSGFYDEEGKPYDLVDNTRLIDDFRSGKPIAFLGAGGMGMVRVRADPDIVNRLLVRANRLARANDPHIDVPSVYDPATVVGNKADNTVENGQEDRTAFAGAWRAEDFKYHTRGVQPSPEKPKGFFNGSWINALSKAFTGKPSKKWAAYENYKIETRISTVQASYAGVKAAPKVNELSWGNIQDAIQKARKKHPDIAVQFNPVKQEDKPDIVNEPEREESALIEPEKTVVQEKPTEEKPVDQKKPEEKIQYQSDDEDIQFVYRPKPENKISRDKKQEPARDDVVKKYEKALMGKNEYDLQAISNDETIKKDKSFCKNIVRGLNALQVWARANKISDGIKDESIATNLAYAYMAGKLVNTFPQKDDYFKVDSYKEDKFEEIDEFHQTTYTRKDIMKELTSFFLNSDVLKKIKQNPQENLDKLVFGGTDFSVIVEEAMKKKELTDGEFKTAYQKFEYETRRKHFTDKNYQPPVETKNEVTVHKEKTMTM